MFEQNYGVVYTPPTLAEFTATLLRRTLKNFSTGTILDPSSGECALLTAAKKVFGNDWGYYGIDIDASAVQHTKKTFKIALNDAILPCDSNGNTFSYWKKNLPKINAIIANPPWSTEKIYEKSKLAAAGFTFISGQYDSYVLFIELAYNILCEHGTMAFIIPDSLFDAQNEQLRRFLVKNTKIHIIARLGEKIFNGVNRSTTVIVCQKDLPAVEDETICFRLSTDARKEYLSGKGTLLDFFDMSCHRVKQSRFSQNNAYNFDIDTRRDEESLLKKIASKKINWQKTFTFGRGVEISKSGKVVYCPVCGRAQGYTKKQLSVGIKSCAYCSAKIEVAVKTIQNIVFTSSNSGCVPIYVGEHIRRYETSGKYYIQPNINGINYKDCALYTSPKLLIRKTGLGIYSTIDYTGSLTSQTVYILKNSQKDPSVPLEYYLALLNSRVIYYYYLKVYGENEWKSHPYLTKKIIYSLPIRPYNSDTCDKQIVHLARELMESYNYQKDLELEKWIMQKYQLSEQEVRLIVKEMQALPNLSAINNMKMESFN